MKNVLLLPWAFAHAREWSSTGGGVRPGRGVTWGLSWEREDGSGLDRVRATGCCRWSSSKRRGGSGAARALSKGERRAWERERARGVRGERRGCQGGTTNLQRHHWRRFSSLIGEGTWGRERRSRGSGFWLEGRQTGAARTPRSGAWRGWARGRSGSRHGRARRRRRGQGEGEGPRGPDGWVPPVSEREGGMGARLMGP
jgi:hypothetical protein